jgi:DNA mismatch repair protein MutS
MFLNTDQQTIEDLGIFGKRNTGGIYELYNFVQTRGGQEILCDMFCNPLSDRDEINRRSKIIAHLSKLQTPFVFTPTAFDIAEKYLLNNQEKQSAQHIVSLNEKEMSVGVSAVINIFQMIKEFIVKYDIAGLEAYQNEWQSIEKLLSDLSFEPIFREKPKAKLSYSAINAYDVLFRLRELNKVKKLFHHIYNLDVYLTVAKVAVERNFIFPVALEKGTCELRLDGVYHPELKKPVANNFLIKNKENLVFLTGANMAGKATFLRAGSPAGYLAHMGFPVAAQSMEFSVMDGLFTTINLPDKLGAGVSHFYAEVLRVKKIATELNKGKSLFVVFDELFRGTNVKDAHEATVAISSAFGGKKSSMFIISSHIVEAAGELLQKGNIGFFYFPTLMNGKTPEYTYTLRKGVTDDRHGMIIIRNEGILDILKNGLK